MLPIFFFETPILIFLGQPKDVSELSGVVLASIPLHFFFAFQFPLQRFLQSQLKNNVIAWANFVAFTVHVLISWLIVYKFQLGIIGTTLTLNFSWWVIFLVLFCYTTCGGCPLSWTGFSMEAFSGLWDFYKLSASSGVMLCLENWYYKVLIVMTGNLDNAKIALDSLSICMNISSWELMIPLGFFAGTGGMERLMRMSLTVLGKSCGPTGDVVWSGVLACKEFSRPEVEADGYTAYLGPVDPESILIHCVLPLPELTEAQATLIRLFRPVVGVSGSPELQYLGTRFDIPSERSSALDSELFSVRLRYPELIVTRAILFLVPIFHADFGFGEIRD
ncbi:putative clathrin assembly protein-like [Capsicum annuum]|nr:putative clathrin assembly protein-like [Capsicum annuum]